MVDPKPRLTFARMLRRCALVLVACCATASAQKLAPIPSASVRVNDNAAMLGENQEASLDTLLSAYEIEKGTRIIVLTVASTAPEQIDQYGARVAEAWKLGAPGGAGDVLILIARDNRVDLRRVRIEVAPALQARLPEASRRRIVNEDIVPPFRYLDYHGGITAGVERIKLLLAGGTLPPAPVPVRPVPVVQTNHDAELIGASAVGVVLLLALAIYLRRVMARRMSYLTGNRALNRAFAPMIVGRIGGRPKKGDDNDGNGFGGGFVGSGVGGYAGGGGDFSGGGASGDW